MLLGALAGMEVIVATPPQLRPDERYASNGVQTTSDAAAAAEGADALYTDVWVSMSDDSAQAASRRELLAPYRLGGGLPARAAAGAGVLHCLPAHPGEEITEGVLYGERSAVWDQAENRLHAQKALMELLVG